MVRLRRGWERNKEDEQEQQQVATGGNNAQIRAQNANPHRQTQGRVRDSDIKAARQFEQEHYGG